MSKKKKPRNKKYCPRDVQADPISWAVAGVHTLPKATIEACMAKVDAAFETLKRGKQRPEDWNHVSTALCVAEALAGLQIGPNLLPQIAKGQHALHKIAMRMADGEKACKAPELAAITEALVMYRAQLHLCTQAEISRAAERARKLIVCGALSESERLYERMQDEAELIALKAVVKSVETITSAIVADAFGKILADVNGLARREDTSGSTPRMRLMS